MRRIVTAWAAAAALLVAASPASAWVCRADGVGATAVGRGYSAERAKFVALSRCERSGLLHVCTIRWCRP